MTPKQILEAAVGERFSDAEGEFPLELDDGFTEEELEEWSAGLPAPPPPEIEELLLFTRGFGVGFGEVDSVDFTGEEFGVGLEELFPNKISFCTDGAGNDWVVDIHPETGVWGAVFYLCHDPPAAVYQSRDLAAFLTELLKLARNQENEITRVVDQAAYDIWREEKALIPAARARESADAALRAFASELPDEAEIADLRPGIVGTGFTLDSEGWRRYGSELLFAIFATVRLEKKRGFFARLFGSTDTSS